MGNNNTNIKPYTNKNKTNEPWGQVIKKTWNDLSPNWYPNFIIGIVFILIVPAIGVIMSNKKVIVYGATAGITILIWLVAFYLIKNISHSPIPNIQKSKTLHDFFKTDFNNLLRFTAPLKFVLKDKEPINFEAQIYADFDAQSIFLGFYIPQSPDTYNICEFLSKNYKNILVELQTKQVAVEARSPGDRPVELKDLKFSGRVFVYHEYPLFASQIEKLTALYKSNSLSPQFRGVDYVYVQNNPLKQKP